jgi:microcin C transport system permease protein
MTAARGDPVVLANLCLFPCGDLSVNLISDLTYSWIGPRIVFETRQA